MEIQGKLDKGKMGWMNDLSKIIDYFFISRLATAEARFFHLGLMILRQLVLSTCESTSKSLDFLINLSV